MDERETSGKGLKRALDAKPDEQPSDKQAHRSKEKKTSSILQHKADTQPYDNDTKALFGQDGARIIPELIAGAEVLSSQNVEVDRSKLKVDLVFQILYQGHLAILNIELQSGPDSAMGSRMLQYLVGLHDFYQLPVICVVIYLFRCTVEESPYVIQCGDKTSLILNYEVIRWWEVDGTTIVNKHATHLYTLLPATKKPKVDLLRRALEEMTKVYKCHELGYRFMWFYRILRRTDTMSEEDKQTIEKELKMQFNYEELIQDDPVIQNLLAERELKGEVRGKAEGKAEGEAQGEIKATRENILSFLTARFSSSLAAQAQPAITSIESVDGLKTLFQLLVRVPDERTIRTVLGLPSD
jgi:predicted transposase YdaD